MAHPSPHGLRTPDESNLDLPLVMGPPSPAWTYDGPSLQLEPAVVETVVTHTTRTTTSFAPIPLPRIPMPTSIGMPAHLPPHVYPLSRAPVPDDLRTFTLDIGGRRVVIQDEGEAMSEGGVSGVSHGPGWMRSARNVKRDDERTNVLDAIKAQGHEARKRSHHSPARRSSASMPLATGTSDEWRSSGPPRKKARPTSNVTPNNVGIMSPLPSPDHESVPISSPSLGTGLEASALFSLPAIMAHFDALPDTLQQHVLVQLLRRSRVPTIQRVLGLASSALRRDFISVLPHELAVQILGLLDVKSLASASRVCSRWYKLINEERSVWKDRLCSDGLHYGFGTEEQEEHSITRRYEVLDDNVHSTLDIRSPFEDGDNDEDDDGDNAAVLLPAYRPTPLKHVYRRRYLNQRNWLRGRPDHLSFVGHGTNVITCLQFDEEKIVSASDDHSINIYNTRTGDLRRRLSGHEGGVWALEYKNDTLVTGSTDRTVRVWDIESPRQAHVFTGHTSTVRCLQIVEPVFDVETGEYQPPYPMIVTGSRDSTLRVWKLPKKGEEPYLPVDSEGDIATVTPESNPYHVHLLAGHTSAVRALAAYGRLCISGSYDSTVRVWDIVKGTCVHVLEGHEDKVYSIVYDKLRNRCVSGSMDNTVKIWDLVTGSCLQTLSGHTSLVGLLGISANHIVSAAADASLRIWDANAFELQHVLSSHAGAITCFQHDETKVISGADGSLKLWDIRTGECVCDLGIGTSSVWQVAFKGNLLIAASNRNNNTFFDVFDFGAPCDPSGVDDPHLDKRMRPPWECGNRLEPRAYQIDSNGLDDDVLSPSSRATRRQARGQQAESLHHAAASAALGVGHVRRGHRARPIASGITISPSSRAVAESHRRGVQPGTGRGGSFAPIFDDGWDEDSLSMQEN